MALFCAVVGSCMIENQTNWIIGLGAFLLARAVTTPKYRPPMRNCG
jgi:hypothetical protein